MNIQHYVGAQAEVISTNMGIAEQGSDPALQAIFFQRVLELAQRIPYEEIGARSEELSDAVAELHKEQPESTLQSSEMMEKLANMELEVSSAAIFYAAWPIPHNISDWDRKRYYEISLLQGEHARSVADAQERLKKRMKDLNHSHTASSNKRKKKKLVIR